MISMKLTPEEAKQENGMDAVAGEQRAYPYGLCLSLDDETLTKLGLSQPPAVGTRMVLHALVEVTTTSQYENQDGKDLSVSLQVTDMELADAAANTDPKSLYPDSNMN